MYMPHGSDYEYRVSDLPGTIVSRRSERALLEEILRITELNRSNENEILEILRKLEEIEEESDNEDTLLEKISNVVSVSPAPGVSLDLGEMVKLFFKWKRRRS